MIFTRTADLILRTALLVALLTVGVAVLFWWYVWGIPGAFMAVPIVATIKVIADHAPGLKAVGEFLGE